MNIQWYPGHMAKATRLIKEDIKKVDVILKLLDARAVTTSENPDFDKIFSGKKIVSIYNKTDLADDSVTNQWREYFAAKDETAFFIDCQHKKGLDKVKDYLNSFKDNFRINRETRAMVVGIPNVGKSMFINAISKKSNARTGNKPGVTMSKQWVKVAGEFYLLDTPGILPPKFETEKEGVVLSSIGSVKDTILDREELAFKLIEYLIELGYGHLFIERYKLDISKDEIEHIPTIDVYEAVAKKRGFIIKGGEFDYLRTAVTILDEFKNGKLGKVSFDKPKR